VRVNFAREAWADAAQLRVLLRTSSAGPGDPASAMNVRAPHSTLNLARGGRLTATAGVPPIAVDVAVPQLFPLCHTACAQQEHGRPRTAGAIRGRGSLCQVSAKVAVGHQDGGVHRSDGDVAYPVKPHVVGA